MCRSSFLKKNSLHFYCKKMDVKITFIKKTRKYISNAENSGSRDSKCMWYIEVLKLFIKYSFLVFNKKEDFSKCRLVLKDKLYKFKNQTGFKRDKELNKLCLHILKRYYGECLNENRCIAYKCDNIRCRKIIHKSNVCKIHV